MNESKVEFYPARRMAIFVRTGTLQEAGRRPIETDEYQLKPA